MNVIQVLPDNVANQIAAGEVVQRPASAAKELLENAIDAQATHIKLIVKEAGKTLLQVIDNGIGMNKIDARTAFLRHATSKIRKAEDIFSLYTKGFRGEALASIAAISQVELITKQKDAELGTRILIQENEVLSQEEVVAESGTSISMKNLFFNTPARRNFLKKDSVELKHIKEEFVRVALAHPDIHFTMYVDDKEDINLLPVSLRKRITHIFGSKIDELLIPIDTSTNMVQMKGFICRPSKKSSYQYFIVNQRFIKSPYLNNAIVKAFEGLLKESQKPEYFIHFSIDPKTIDINIHPTKTEIKFENEQIIYTLLLSAVKHALGQYRVKESLDFSENPIDLPYSYKYKTPEAPSLDIDPNFNPFKLEDLSEEREVKTPSNHSGFQQNTPKKYIEKTASWESLFTEIPSKANIFEIEKTPEILPLFDFKNEDLTWDNQKNIIFQNRYLFYFQQEKILIINILRASQRIFYEKILKNFSSAQILPSQKLLFPLEIEFSFLEQTALEELTPLLKKIGFSFEKKDHIISFDGLPTFLEISKIQDVLSELFFNHNQGFVGEDEFHNEIIAKKMAKSLAFRTLKTDGVSETEFLKDLFACEKPYVSPFGKKIIVEILSSEIENKFI